MSNIIYVPYIVLGREQGSPIRWITYGGVDVDPTKKISALDEHIVDDIRVQIPATMETSVIRYHKVRSL